MRLIEKARAVLHAWTRPAPAPADVIELAQWLYDNGGVGSGSFQDALAESRRVRLSLLDGSLSAAPPATAAPLDARRVNAEVAEMNARAALLAVQAARVSCPLERERLSASAALLALRSSRIAGVPSTSTPALQESSDASA